MTARSPAAIRIPIAGDADVFAARRCATALALDQGLSEVAACAAAIAVAEVARNIVVHAGRGELLLEAVEDRGRRGIAATARDRGRGIADVESAMRDGFSTAAGLGLGLPSARRLMDDFALESAIGEGTTVRMRKWA